MKTKIIGIFCLLVGVLAFVDTVKYGGLNLGTWHLKPFLFPAFCLGLGWIELHGRHDGARGRYHHSYILTVIAAALIVITLLCVLYK